MSEADQPKIIVDDDWKSSAQAEKEKLAAAEKENAAKAAESGGLPEEVGFRELLSMLASQALMYMGAFPDQSGRAMVALDIAKLNIDMLGVLQEKTKGNLSEEEDTMLTQTVNELRLQFVEVTKAVAKASEDGTLQSMDPNQMGGQMGGPMGGPIPGQTPGL